MDKKKKTPIVQKLLNDGYFISEKEAASWILMGKVYANNELITTCGHKVCEDCTIRIKDFDRKYVSKGGFKLEGALTDLNVGVKNKVAFDAGASTGGFTDCLLQHGAKKVYAIEVGFGQLNGRLRQDVRVINMEKTNIGDDILLALEDKPEIVTLDLSYLSLKKAIPICAGIMGHRGTIICLVKPLFEVESQEARRTGIIDDESLYTDVLTGIADFVNHELGFSVFGITHSHIRGNKGTIEFFMGISLDDDSIRLSDSDIRARVQTAVMRACTEATI